MFEPWGRSPIAFQSRALSLEDRLIADWHEWNAAARLTAPDSGLKGDGPAPTIANYIASEADDDYPYVHLEDVDGTDGFRFVSRDGGGAIAAGDLNGDGIADFIFAESFPYRIDVVFGTQSGFSGKIQPDQLDGDNGFKIESADYLGSSLATGDVNGDGIADLIIGASEADPNDKTNAGRAYVVFGNASGWNAEFDTSDLDGSNGFWIDGVSEYDYFGTSVSSGGDVNGDGIADFVIGATGANLDYGAAYVVFGKAGGWAASFDVSSLNGMNGFRISGVDSGDDLGDSVALAGDINNDGFDDIIVGASGADPNGLNDAGETYVIFGKASGWSDDILPSSLDGTDGFRLQGIDPGGLSGFSVTLTGDVNGDGCDDLLIGAYKAFQSSTHHGGEAYVVFGKPSGWDPVIDLSSLDGTNGFRFQGDTRWRFGTVAKAGDVDADGYDDVIVGSSEGQAWLVFGKPSDWSPTLKTSEIDGSNGFSLLTKNYLRSLSAGDLNNDGYSDLLFGDPGYGRIRARGFAYFGHERIGPRDIQGTTDDDSISGNAYGDTLRGLAGDDELSGQAGDDILVGNRGQDTLYGGDDDDVLRGGGGNDILWGGNNDDYLDGGDDLDVLRGEDGNDRLIDKIGGDTLEGGRGDDIYIIEAGSSVIVENASEGYDTVRADATFTLPANVEKLILHSTDAIDGYGNDDDNVIIGFGGANYIRGLRGDDYLSGGGGDDTMRGGYGNDTLNGGNGNDSLIGGDASDRLVGEAGFDTLTGGTSNDIFIFRGASLFDTITDFEDRLDLINLIDYRSINGGSPLTIDDLLITQQGTTARIEFDFNHDDIADTPDLDGDGSDDAWHVDLLDTDISVLTAADFVF